jgi:hypothetical protein
MAFPTTGLLDQFNRANETPLSGGGNWAVLSTSINPLKLLSNEIAPQANDDDSSCR